MGGCSGGQCFVNPADAGLAMNKPVSTPMQLLMGDAYSPARRKVVGGAPGPWRPRQNCGMPYTVDQVAGRKEYDASNTELGCATGAREVVATAPSGCATCGGTKPAG